MLEVRQSRTRQLVEIAALYFELYKRNGNASALEIRKLKASRQTLRNMHSDAQLKPIAQKTLTTVDNMLDYVETKEQRYLDAAIKAHHEADALIYAVMAKESGK